MPSNRARGFARAPRAVAWLRGWTVLALAMGAPLHAEPPTGASADPIAEINSAWRSRIGLEGLAVPRHPRRTVALVDTGVDFRHEDLDGIDSEAYAALPHADGKECPGGYCCPRAAEPVHRSHGTAVAGVITGTRGGGRGIAGVGRAGRIVSVDAFDAAPGGLSRVAAGIGCALDKHADVINVSVQGMAGAVPAPELAAALERAGRAGALVVMAAGNGISDLDRDPEWPAAFRSATSLTVTAVDSADRLTGQHFGLRRVDLAAPATERMVCSAAPDMESGKRTDDARDPCGTTGDGHARHARFGQSSAAAAMVSGAALLTWEHPNYRECSAEQIRALLLKHARVPDDAATRTALSPFGGILDLRFLGDVVRTREGVIDLCSGAVH